MIKIIIKRSTPPDSFLLQKYICKNVCKFRGQNIIFLCLFGLYMIE